MRSAFKMKGYSYPGKAPVKQKVDPDAPGTPGKPGYEPPVDSMDYLTKTPVGPRADVKKPKGMTDKEDEIDAAKWQLEDKMKDEGVFSIGGQKNKSVKKYTSDDEEQAYENAQNDFDTDNPTKAQLAKALKKVKAGK